MDFCLSQDETDISDTVDMAGRIFIIMMMMTASWTVTAHEVREFYNGARALAMGGASIAVANDETSLALNPAGLGKLRDIYGTILDPEIETSDNLLNLYRSSPFGGMFEPEKIVRSLSENLGTTYHAKATMFPSFVAKNFGIGLIRRNTLDARVDDTGTLMNTFYQDDMALLLGFNLKMWGGRIKLGATGKFISRIEIDKDLPVSGPLDIASNASEGAAVGADIGLNLTAPVVWLPTLSAVVRDVGGTRFSAGSGLRMSTANRPNAMKQDVDVALAVFPIHSQDSRSVFTAEYRKIGEAATATDKTRYSHLGYEYNYGDTYFFRMGMNQKYWTTGFEIASEYTQFQIAYYGEDIGSDGDSEEQRRLVMKFTFRF